MMRLAHEVNAVVNEMNRTGGFSPVQWVLGRRPRYSSGEQGDDEQFHMLEGVQERVDPTTIFAERMAIRHEAMAMLCIDYPKEVQGADAQNLEIGSKILEISTFYENITGYYYDDKTLSVATQLQYEFSRIRNEKKQK